MQHRHAERGFNIVELMVAIGVMALLLGIAVPSFREAGLSSQLRSSSMELIAGANLARSEAIKRNRPVVLCVSTDGGTCSAGGWEQGWIVVDSSAVPAVLIRRGDPAPQGLKISASASTATVTFQPTGAGATPVTLTVCRPTPPGPQERVVTINAAGRVSSRITTTGTCPA